MDTIRIDRKQTKMIAHRGVSGLERENSYPAFVAAGNRSYFGIETDVHSTSDGEFIILHDDSTERVTGTALIAEETPLDALRTLHMLDPQTERPSPLLVLPTLEEYIRVCKKYGKIAVLELKNPMDEATVCRLIDRIEACGYGEGVIYISFSFDNLVYVRKRSPKSPCQFLFVDPQTVSLQEICAHRFDVDVHCGHLTEAWIRAFHDAGCLVNCWTVNEREEAERLVAWGVDQITSNILE